MHAMLTYRGAVYAWHCDHYGHMNNMFYAAKFDEGSWNAATQLGFSATHMRASNTGLATVEQVTTFKRELLAGETIEVWTRVLEVRERVIRMEHAMHNVETGELCATCAITAVHIDLALRRAAPIPELQMRMAQDLLAVSEAA
ncbi:MAG: acyl-CoA thioesterase [Phenylobacterium sp.]